MSVTVEKFGVEKTKELIPYKKNPRKGDVRMIAESLKVNGQYKPIIIRENTKEVLVGNHTLKAAQSLGWEEITVGYVVVTDSEAKRIMLADNRTSDAGSYDYDLLAEVISDLPDVSGTGYSEADRDMLAQSILVASEDTSKTLEDIVHETPSFGIIEQRTDIEEAYEEQAGTEATSGFLQPNFVTEKDQAIESLDDVSSDLEGILEMKTDVIFPIENYWGVPQLKREMLLSKLPDELHTWAGPDATDMIEGASYLYNYGVDSARGLPWEKAILSFYTHDIHFENWWSVPAHYTAKVVNAGLTMAITPNYSIFIDDPRVIQLWQVYRSRWMGRYMQEAGVKIIPDVAFPDLEAGKYAMEGIPKNPPIIAMQWQSIRPHETKAIASGQENTRFAVEHLQPETLLIYGSKTGHKAVEDLNLDCNVVYLMNRAAIRRGKVFDHKKGYSITDMGDDEDESIAPKSRKRKDAPHGYGTKLGTHGE